MARLTQIRQMVWTKKATPFHYSRIKDGDNLKSPDRSSLENGSQDGLLEKGDLNDDVSLRRTMAAWQKPKNLLFGHLILLGTYVAVLIAITGKRSHLRSRGLPWSPAIEALEFRDQKFSLEDTIQEKGSFSGKPNTDLDKAWHDLLNAENIVIETKYMKYYEREHIGVAVPGGEGYLGTLNVYHELHCLKRLHQYMYPEYYFPDLSARQMEMNRLHNEHCIDFLRQSAMCHGDVGLITYEWHDDSLIPVANATSHQCVNWEKLDKWTKERTVDMLKPGWLVHPLFGIAYPTGEGDKIGAVDTQGGSVGQVGEHHRDVQNGGR